MTSISNRAPRPVSFRGNSGQTWHLAPGVSIDIADAEIADNPKVQKLIGQLLIAIEASSSGADTTFPDKPHRSRSRTTER
jgi:hypothetical protein